MHEVRRKYPHVGLSAYDYILCFPITGHVLLLSISKASHNIYVVDSCPLFFSRTLLHKGFFLPHDFIPLHSDMLLIKASLFWKKIKSIDLISDVCQSIYFLNFVEKNSVNVFCTVSLNHFLSFLYTIPISIQPPTSPKMFPFTLLVNIIIQNPMSIFGFNHT